MIEQNKIYQGDTLEVLKSWPDEFVECVITSPPYWGLRDYGTKGQLGLEKTPEEYVAKMVEVFRECKRVLKKEGTVWLNLGDSYANGHVGRNDGGIIDGKQKKIEGLENNIHRKIPKGLKHKDLVGIPWRVAFALQADGWYLRQDIIWYKPNPMPESVTDRCTKSHEYVFLLAKSQKYYFDAEAIKEPMRGDAKAGMMRGSGHHEERGFPNGPQNHINRYFNKSEEEAKIVFKAGRNKRSVWTVTTKPFKEAHFATFPPDLIIPMVKAGCPKEGVVLDPFIGSGTTAVVAKSLGRNYLGIELNPAYIKMAERRLAQEVLF